MKKSIIRISLILFVGILALTGCKKGENDPFLSFLSRNARITGTWKLTSHDYKKVTTYASSGTTATTTSTQEFDGNIMTITNQYGTNSYSYSWELVIEKDGIYSQTTIEDGTQNENTGNWWWLEDTKDKTRIAFDDDADSFLIDQLKNKEMILTNNYTTKTTNTSGDYTESVITASYTFTKQ